MSEVHELDLAVDDGTQLHVRMYEGDGPALLLLHDLDCSGAYWDAVVARLLERDPNLPVVVPDLRGHGASTMVEEASRKRLVRDLKNLCKSLQLEHPVVCGHGWGADIGLATDFAASVVAVNPLLGRKPAAFDEDVPRPEGMLGAASERARESALVGATTAKPLRRGPREAPLLIVCSQQLDLPALQESEPFERAADVQVVQSGSRHLPVEMPNAVAALLLYWIEETA